MKKINDKLKWLKRQSEDIKAMMEVGHYFELEELVEEINLIGVAIMKEFEEVDLKLQEDLLTAAEQLVEIDRNTANEKVLELANKLEELAKKSSQNLAKDRLITALFN